MDEAIEQIDIFAVPHDMLHNYWDLASQFIERALLEGYDEMDTEDVHTLLENGTCILILVIKGSDVLAGIVANLVEKPALRELIILTAAGKHLDEWLPAIMETFDMLAIDQQADVISVHGRRAWVKKLAPYGYMEAYTTVIKKVM